MKKYGVETKIVIANFVGGNSMAFYDRIMAETANIDIGLVVLNAGVCNVGYI